MTGLSNAWLSVIVGILALIFGSSPYNLSVRQLGMFGIGGLVASLLAFTAGPLNDWICKFMARRNKGIYEPEV
jgi:predicted exporter